MAEQRFTPWGRVSRKAAHPYGQGAYMMLSVGGVGELRERLVDGSLGMQAVKVLMAMIECADYENRIEADQSRLCEMSGMKQSAVSRASRQLMDCGLIERSKYRRGWYRLSPNLAWKGGATNLEKALKEARSA